MIAAVDVHTVGDLATWLCEHDQLMMSSRLGRGAGTLIIELRTKEAQLLATGVGKDWEAAILAALLQAEFYR